MGLLSRSECRAALKKGQITVNGSPQKQGDTKINPDTDEIKYLGKVIPWQEFYYVIINKPEGYVCAREDAGPIVMDLIDAKYLKAGCFPCGRLDKYTTGLLLITNDGDLSHSLLSPAKHVSKDYYYECENPLSDEDISVMEKGGMDLGDFSTLPSEIEKISERSGVITIFEGKFHQIKRMFDKTGNKITSLKRIRFGPLHLGSSLSEGEWRELSQEETNLLRKQGEYNDN